MWRSQPDRHVGFDDTGARVYAQPEMRCLICGNLLSGGSLASNENGAFPDGGVLHDTAPVCRHYNQVIGFDPAGETNDATCICSDCGAIIGVRDRESWDMPWSKSWPKPMTV